MGRNLGIVTSHEICERFNLSYDFYDDLHSANDRHGTKYLFRKGQSTEGSLFDLMVSLNKNKG